MRVLDLADTFLADPQLLADLRERLLGDAAEPVLARENPPLALVEPTEPGLTADTRRSRSSSASGSSRSASGAVRESSPRARDSRGDGWISCLFRPSWFRIARVA